MVSFHASRWSGSGCGDRVILSLRGEFDLAVFEAFNSAVSQAAPGSSVILDLRHLSFLDSSGLRQ